MDAASRSAAIGVIGALIGAIGTVLAAYVNLLKPSEKQIESSDRYQAVQLRLSQLELSLQQARTAPQTALPERLSSLEASNAGLRAENSQLHARIGALEFDARRLAAAPASASPPPITRPAQVMDSRPTAAAIEPQLRKPYTVAMDAITRTYDGTTISMWALREYADRKLGANFYVDGKSGKTYYPGQRITAKRTHDAECYFDVISLEGSDKAPSTAKASIEYVCTSL